MMATNTMSCPYKPLPLVLETMILYRVIYWGYIGMMEKKMETIVLYRDFLWYNGPSQTYSSNGGMTTRTTHVFRLRVWVTGAQGPSTPTANFASRGEDVLTRTPTLLVSCPRAFSMRE